MQIEFTYVQMMYIEAVQKIDSLIFKNPKKLDEVKYDKIEIFKEGWQSIELPNPPSGSQIEKELREITKTNDEWEFDGVKPGQFHSIANLMEELWLMRFWDDRMPITRVEPTNIDKFVQSYLEQLNDKGDSLPAIETWH